MFTEFEDVYYAGRYDNTKAESENTELVKNILDCGFVRKIIYICVFQYFCDFAI